MPGPDHAITIRKADETDIQVISQLAHAIWPDAYRSILSESQISYMLDLFYQPQSLKKQMDDGHIFLIALINAETVGFASYSPIQGGAMYKVHKLYVHPLLHGKGFGKKMLDYIVANGKKNGAKKIQLDVNRNNTAKNFYERYGFSAVGNKDTDIGQGFFMTDYVMEMNVL